MKVSCARSLARSASLRASRLKKLRTADWWRRTRSSNAPRSSCAMTGATSAVSLSLMPRLALPGGRTARDLARGQPSLQEIAEARHDEQQTPSCRPWVAPGQDVEHHAEADTPAEERDPSAEVVPALLGQRELRRPVGHQLARHRLAVGHEPLDERELVAVLATVVEENECQNAERHQHRH